MEEMKDAPSPASPAATHDRGDAGYDKGLKPRHIQMIAIGGSIGTGLFLGAGGRLIGVLDIDSDLPDAFTAADSAALEGILHDVFGKL